MTHSNAKMPEADYVIIGAGSAGCALAYRLSEDGRHSVLVLEYGGSDFGPLIQMPAAFSIPMNMRAYDWGYKTEPEPHLGGRRLSAPRGKVVGGSSSINGMVYVRGHAADFDRWEEQGATGWGFRNVLPYFKRMENAHLNGHGATNGNGAANGALGWRGTDGPLHVTRGSMTNPLYQAFTEAGLEAGYPFTADYNGAQQEGFGPMEMNVWKGRRWSAANAYLRPALKRPNVRLITGARAERILFEGRRAVGVSVRRRGRQETVGARKEVIVAASAFNSPQLLMLSGIGPAEHLSAHGIEIVANRPGVGGNLQDHLEVYVQQTCRHAITLNAHLGLRARVRIGLQWMAWQSGLGASNHFEACAFIRSRAGIPTPDLQLHFLPAAVRYDGRAAANAHGFQVHVGPMRSASRGAVRLKSGDPRAAPAIRFNYMAEPEDWSDFRHAIRLTREIFAQPALAAFGGEEIAPGSAVQSDDALDDFVRDHVESAYHPCGTCRMGPADEVTSVVDSDCRVISTHGLRVVDSSIFPTITNGNTNAPSIMVGERAADLILDRPPLPASNLQPWINPAWETTQR